MMPYVVSCLRRDLAEIKPDFIMATGDIASGSSRDAVFAARDLMDSLRIPYYPMVGNHESVSREGRGWFLEAFGARLPNRDNVYSLTHSGLHFCVLDAWWQWADGTLCPQSERPDMGIEEMSGPGAAWAIPPHQLAWLTDDLEAHAGMPTVVCTHYPAASIPVRMRHRGLRDAGHLENGVLFVDLLKRFPQVKVILSGHIHMHFIEPLNGLVQVVTGALPEYPVEYREVQVHKDRLEITTRTLSDTSFAARSLIPGREWTAGEPQDRTAVIPLD